MSRLIRAIAAAAITADAIAAIPAAASAGPAHAVADTWTSPPGAVSWG